MTKSQKTILHVSERELSGKKSKKLRHNGKIPGNVYGQGKDSEQITIDVSAFNKIISDQGDSTLIYLQVGEDKQIPTLISEIQYDAMTDQPIHVAFKRVNLRQKVTAEITVEMTGELEVANANATLTRNILEVEALPADLPEVFEIDISGLTEVGQSIYLSDLEYDREKVTVLLSEEELEAPLVVVQEVKEEVEETPEETEGAEGETPTESTEESAEEAAPAEEKAE